MKQKLTLIILLIATVSYAQKITNDNYLKLGGKIWKQYHNEIVKIKGMHCNYPTKKDSLDNISKLLLQQTIHKLCKLTIKFARTPSGIKQLYALRLHISKDTLANTLNRLPDSIKNSTYGKSILAHIKSKQIEIDEKFYDFTATTAIGNKFILSSLKERNILFIYGGLECMGKSSRNYLDSLYSITSRENFDIVAYCEKNDLRELQATKEKYSIPYIIISDFEKDYSMIKIRYGIQTTPTCIFINKKGVLVMKAEGVNQSLINKFLKIE